MSREQEQAAKRTLYAKMPLNKALGPMNRKIFWFIYASRATTATMIGQHFDLHEASVSNHITRLLNLDLITTTKDPKDKRRHLLEVKPSAVSWQIYRNR